jgi:hypothetical protein
MEINESASLLSLDGSLYVPALLFGLSNGGSSSSSISGGCGSLVSLFCYLLLSKLNIIILAIVLLEGGSINMDYAVFDDSLGSDKLVIGGIVNNVQKPGSLGDLFRSPSEVAGVKSKCSVLIVTTSASHRSDLLGSKLSGCWCPCHLKLSLLLMNWHSSTSSSSFVS